MLHISLQSGLGDALIAQPVIAHIAYHTIQAVTVYTKHIDIFTGLPGVIALAGIAPKEALKLHWFLGREENAFQQLCSIAEREFLVKDIYFKFVWPMVDFEESDVVTHLGNRLPLKINKKLCIIKKPYTPQYISNTNMFYENYAADVKTVQNFIDENKDKYYFISVGQNTLYSKGSDNITGIDLNLENNLSLLDFIYLCMNSDVIASQLGHLTTIAALFNKPYKCFRSNFNDPKTFENRYKATAMPGMQLL